MEIPADEQFHLKEIKTHHPNKDLFIRTIKCDDKGRIC